MTFIAMAKNTDYPRLTNTEGLILELILAGHQYGLAMVRASDGELSRAGLYTTLDRIEQKGLITSKEAPTKAGEQGPPRRIFSITGLGQRALSAHHAAQAVFARLAGATS